eukprot:m51a1_g2002 putative serine threonine kinase (107) ;mRNA; f:1227765-1228484
MQGLYECRYAIPAATSFRIDIRDRSVIDCISSKSTSISDPDGMNSLNKKWDVKLSDFGLAAIKETNKTNTVCGTVGWMALEVLKEGKYSEKSDIFRCGTHAVCLVI